MVTNNIKEADSNPVYCTSIYDTPLERFENCLLNNNLNALIISGHPQRQDIEKAWQKILAEYSARVSSTEYNLYLNMFRELSLLRLTYDTITKVLIPIVNLHLLQKVTSNYFRDELNRHLRTKFKFDINDPVSYKENLENCKRRTGGLKIQLDLKQIEFDGIKEKFEQKEGKELDRNYFTSVLIVLSRHNQYRITKEILVSEYVEYLKQFNSYCDLLNKERSEKKNKDFKIKA